MADQMDLAPGISQRFVDGLVQAALDQLRSSEVERARAVWRKKFAAAPQDATARARQMRFLAARGFSGDTIRKVVGGSDED